VEFSTLHDAVIRGDAETVTQGVIESLEKGLPPGDILNQALVPAMSIVGDMFEKGEVYVPEMLIAAHAMKAGLKVLRPELTSAGVEPIGKVALGTVKGDIHDIGKNLVGMMMEGAGFEIVDLGVDVPTEKFIEVVKSGIDILCLSGLLTTTIPAMPVVLEALQNARLRENAHVLVGGAPVTEQFANDIGADGYAPDAASAVRLAKQILKI
jgi:5-methyltetrahydrofolate--homocysteine methyltransferase